jgi:hypothetical protein
MSISAEQLLRQALQLPSNERAALLDGLVMSLDRPDSSLDALWIKEATDRLAAYRSGELGAVDAEAVFAELERKR